MFKERQGRFYTWEEEKQFQAFIDLPDEFVNRDEVNLSERSYEAWIKKMATVLPQWGNDLTILLQEYKQNPERFRYLYKASRAVSLLNGVYQAIEPPKRPEPVRVGIVGPSGLGKTHISVALEAVFSSTEYDPGLEVFYLDHFSKDSQKSIKRVPGYQPGGRKHNLNLFQDTENSQEFISVMDNFENSGKLIAVADTFGQYKHKNPWFVERYKGLFNNVILLARNFADAENYLGQFKKSKPEIIDIFKFRSNKWLDEGPFYVDLYGHGRITNIEYKTKGGFADILSPAVVISAVDIAKAGFVKLKRAGSLASNVENILRKESEKYQ